MNCLQMVLQAKLERRQRRQSEKCHKNNEATHSIGTDNTAASHPQSIPPPSEPVLLAGKVLSPKAENGSEMTRAAGHVSGETASEYYDIHAQTVSMSTGDKGEARQAGAVQKSELE